MLRRVTVATLFAVAGLLCPDSADAQMLRPRIARVGGDLGITRYASTDTFTAYFHVPVPDEDQVPLAIEITSPDVVDWRLLRCSGSNILAAARMCSNSQSTITWRAWVLIDEQTYLDVPGLATIPSYADLPDSVKPFLQSTATAQSDCSLVQYRAEAFADYRHVVPAADAVCDYVHGIPGIGDHVPVSFDAFYALVWGSSCTGHTHAATALLRALDIPARTKLCFLTWYSSPLDMHWTTDYFVPGYGWVGMDAEVGEHPLGARREVVVWVCDPADEFPLFYDHGIDCFWHTSDPILGGNNPTWRLAHQLIGNSYLYVEPAVRDELFELAREAFDHEIATRGVRVSVADAGHLGLARLHHTAARDRLMSGDGVAGAAELAAAVAEYRSMARRPRVTRFHSGFEDGAPGWTHGGANDEWELGPPAAPGPPAAYAGSACWGTDLDGEYENGTNCWLLSPPVDLSGLRAAQLEFRVWSQTCGRIYDALNDRLTVEVVDDAGVSVPLCSPILGGNDDPEIAVVGGWSRLDLDLAPFVGRVIHIRYRFFSDGADRRAGVYLDEMRITGVGEAATAVGDPAPGAGPAVANLRAAPNPFNPRTRISFDLEQAGRVRVTLYNALGRRVAVLADRDLEAGPHAVAWDGTDVRGRAVAAGGYLARVEVDGRFWSCKATLVR